MTRAKRTAALILTCAVMLFVLTACSNASAREEFFKVGPDSIPTLYTVAGEKKIVGSSAGFENGESYKYVQYDAGVTANEMQNYVSALEAIGYAQIGETERDGNVQKILMGSNSMTSGKKILVNITLDPEGVTQIDYTVSDGSIEFT